MKIALLTTGIYPYDIGGIQKHSYNLAKYFAQKQIPVDVYCSVHQSNKEIDLKEYFETTEFSYINFIEIVFPKPPNIPGHYVYTSWLFSKNIYLEMQKMIDSYDAIYSQGLTSWYFLQKNPFRHNLITNLHGLEMFQKTINFKHWIGQLMLQIPARFIIKNSWKQISLGGKLTDILYQIGARENSVIELPNGIDSSWIRDINHFNLLQENKKIQLVFVGRYERRKGIEEFQEVVEKTIDNLEYKVILIGPIPKRKQLKHPNVKYTGAITESDIIKSYLTTADILVCPSYSEGMPTVILEAMARGCAIIATDVGANATMVSEDNGWLLKGDIVSELEKAIEKAVNLPSDELKIKKINSVQKVSDEFTWDRIIDKTIKEIKSCIDS